MGQYRFFSVQSHDEAIVVAIVDTHLQGETMAEFLGLELHQIVESAEPKVVVMSFKNVKMVSTCIISFLLSTSQWLSGQGVLLKLSDMNDGLRHTFDTLRLNGVLSIFPTSSEALASHSGPTTYEDVCDRPTPFDLDNSDM